MKSDRMYDFNKQTNKQKTFRLAILRDVLAFIFLLITVSLLNLYFFLCLHYITEAVPPNNLSHNLQIGLFFSFKNDFIPH